MIPSSFMGAGSAVIDAAQSNVFSATVNGSSTVNAYQLIIYKNTTMSEIVYDTGVVTLETPFVATDYTGAKIRFTVTVPSNNQSVTPHTDLINEFTDGYKWTLSLWSLYDQENPTSTKITSVENYIRAKISSFVVVDPLTAPSTINSRTNIWKATLTSTSPCMQFRWHLAAVEDGVRTEIYTSTWVYQAAQIWFEYDGLISGTTYAVRAEVMTQDGVTVYSPWKESTVSYSSLVVSGATTVEYVDGGVLVGWGGVQYIVGVALFKNGDTPSTNYSILDDYPSQGEKTIIIGDDTYIKFESSETFGIDLTDGGTVVLSIYVDEYVGSDVTIAVIESDDGIKTRTLKHSGFTRGLRVGSGVHPMNGLYPSNGTYGNYIYINGETSITKACNRPVGATKSVICLSDNDMTVYEYNREVV